MLVFYYTILGNLRCNPLFSPSINSIVKEVKKTNESDLVSMLLLM